MFNFLDGLAQRFADWAFASWRHQVVWWIAMAAVLCVTSWGVAEILVGTNAVHLPKLDVAGIVLSGWVVWMAAAFVGAVVRRLMHLHDED